MTRRIFGATSAAALAAAAAAAAPNRKMTIQLSAGSIGVKADQQQAIEYASRFGFESVDAYAGQIANMSEDARKRMLDDMRAKKVVWGNAGLTVDFRGADAAFQSTLKDFPRIAAALQSVGVTRVTTWITSFHDTLNYLENFKQHTMRLRECAKVLADHGQRLGLEYLGPKTLWTSKRHSFIHSMKEGRELIAAIGTGNVGFVIDSWHWFTAHETVADLETLKNSEIVSCDLNDAPAGREIDQQIDSQRELPMATGVIDTKGFLSALVKVGCDAPVRAEPFNAALRAMPPEQALQATIDAMKKAFALIGG